MVVQGEFSLGFNGEKLDVPSVNSNIAMGNCNVSCFIGTSTWAIFHGNVKLPKGKASKLQLWGIQTFAKRRNRRQILDVHTQREMKQQGRSNLSGGIYQPIAITPFLESPNPNEIIHVQAGLRIESSKLSENKDLYLPKSPDGLHIFYWCSLHDLHVCWLNDPVPLFFNTRPRT